MNLVSKELALILKERGFKEDCCDYIEIRTISGKVNQWKETAPQNFNAFDNLISVPTEHQVLDWLFKDIENLTSTASYLEFWYNTLLEYKFNLMHEFIGRLEDWFENNNMLIVVEHCNVPIKNKWSFEIFRLPVGVIVLWYKDTPFIYDTRTHAKHNAILKCFELLKEIK